MREIARMAWARGARIAALGGVAYGGINAVVASLRVGPLEALEILLVYGALASMILWPLCAGGCFCAMRWVGLEPAPWIWDGARPWWRLALVGLAGTVVLYLGSVALAIAFAPMLEGGSGPIDELARLPGAGRAFIATTAVWEEAVFRLAVLFPLLALFGVRGAARERVPPALAWVAILLAGLLFAAAHAGNITGEGATGYLLFSLVQKGLFVSGVLGWLTWRYGLEAAVLAHFGLDVVALA